MRVTVTGGAGFIGSNLVHRLVHEGHLVTVLDNFATGRRENLASLLDRIRLVEGDLRDAAAVATAVAGSEVIFHQAALAAVARSVESPREVTEVNVMGTLTVLMAARDARARRVVFASSSSVYGDTPTLPKVETMPASPRSPYAASKVAGEAYMGAFQTAYGLETVSLRYFNVYGPRQSARSRYAAVVPLFVEAMSEGRPPAIYGDGGQTRDFTWVGDLVEALILAATAPGAVQGPINLGAGGRTSILELARLVAQATGFSGKPTHLPARAGDVRDSLADVTRARTWLGWEPRTALAQGVAELVASRRAAPESPSHPPRSPA